MRRRRHAHPLGLALAIAGVTSIAIAGCTFLVSFDDRPLDPDPTLPDARNPTRDTSPEPDPIDRTDPPPVRDAQSPVDAGFPPPCDESFPVEQVDCTGHLLPTCAKSTFFSTYPSETTRANDLVECDGNGHPTCVRHCPFGCTSMLDTYPDQCDDCNGREDGYHCGKDLRNWPARNDDLAIKCEDGRSIGVSNCGAGACATTCTRVNPPPVFPSCCM